MNRANAVSTFPTMSLTRWFHSGRPPAWVGGRLELLDKDAFARGEFLLLGQDRSLRIAAPGLRVEGHSLPQAGAAVRLLVEQGKADLSDNTLTLKNPASLFVETDALARPPSISSSPKIQQEWFAFLRTVESLLIERGLLRVGTPTLVICPGVEPVLEPMATLYRQRFLPTSPELHLKKLLAHSYTDFFEIRSCFRVETPSAHHEPEFTMLEWYRGYATSEILVEDLQYLLHRLSAQGLGPSPLPPLRKRSMAELFRDFIQIELTPKTPLQDLWLALDRWGLPYEKNWSWDDCFHLLFLEKIENHLGVDGPEVVCDYPPSQAALAKLTAQGWADRMELYWNGLELANGFGELTNAQAQRARFGEEIQERNKRGMTKVPLDEDFLKALESGIPPSAGMALGLERLFMALKGLHKIQDLKLFPEYGNN